MCTKATILPEPRAHWLIALVAYTGMISMNFAAARADDGAEIRKDLKTARYQAPVIAWNRTFYFGKPIRGEFTEPTEGVFVSYREISGPLTPLSKNLIRLLSAIQPEQTIPDKELVPVPAECEIVLFDGAQRPLYLLAVKGAAPIAFATLRVVDDWTFQLDGARHSLHISSPAILKEVDPLLRSSKSIWKERKAWAIQAKDAK